MCEADYGPRVVNPNTDSARRMLGFTDRQILQILQVNAEAEAACQALVNAANTAGGTDNITVLVVGCG